MDRRSAVLKLSKLTAASLIALAIGGCGVATLQADRSQRALSDQHVFEKSYELGKLETVNVGEPVVKFRNYWVEYLESQEITPDRNASVTFNGTEFKFIAGQKYQSPGRLMMDGIEYTMVDPRIGNSVMRLFAMVGPDGALANRMAISPNNNQTFMVSKPSNAAVSDASAKFSRNTTQSVKASKGYENFEILYTGINSSGLNLTYREFTQDGMARVAFYQNLTYEANAKQVTFKKLKIAIDRASSESISFRVLADGY